MTPIQLAFTLAAFAIAFAWLLRLTRRMNGWELDEEDEYGINMDDLMAAYDGTRDLLSEAFSHIPRNTELWHRVRRELWGDGGGEGGCGDGFGDGAGDEEETITVMKNCGAKSKLKIAGDG